MNRVYARALAAAALVLSLSTAFSGSASAADPQPGWLRLTPSSATIDDPIDVLSQAPCPTGTNIQVTLTGPGIPNDPMLGSVVGNTFITALPSTPTKQLYVPLTVTLRQWFSRNVPGLTPSGTYTMTLKCRAALRPTYYGSFVALVRVTKDGKYSAQGEAAKPFNVTPAADPDFDPQAAASASAAMSPGTSSSPAADPNASAQPTAGSSLPAPGATASQPAASAPSTAPSESAGQAASTGTSTTDASTQPAATGGSGAAGKIVLLGGLAILGAVALSWWRGRRPNSPGPDVDPASSDDREHLPSA
jgi:hypothetical protein